MHILFVNDDGILAEGLLQLVEAAVKRGHRATVVAPDCERSGASHSISITKPLRLRRVPIAGAEAYSLDGTPADCARVGLYILRNDMPDITISGINRGQNLGGACIYSGTVGAAMEASMAGCTALASSLRSFTQNDYSTAAEITLETADWAFNNPLARGEMYNLNIPDLPRDKMLGLRRTQTLAPAFLTDAWYQEFTSDYNNRYLFLADGEGSTPYPPDSDDVLNKSGYCTLSVLSWDIAANSRRQ